MSNQSEDATREELPDHAAELDERALPIERVGIRGLSYPIKVWDRSSKEQHTVGEIEMGVGLPQQFKGTHMSRFVEVLNDFRGELSLRTVPELLAHVQQRLESDDAWVRVKFPYFLEREAPVSGARSLMEYQCRFEAERRGDSLDFVLGVEVPVTTLCPCSKAISEYGAHNQRSLVDVQVRFDEMIWIEDVVEVVEDCASSPLYALLKREDEKWVTERAYENPRFVEDMVRETVLRLRELEGARWIRVECQNMEAIHKHDAFARLTWPNDDPPRMKMSLPVAAETVSFGEWLRTQRVQRGVSQARLAETIGVSGSLLSRVENGEKSLSLESLSRLARQLGLEPRRVQLRAGVFPPSVLGLIQGHPEEFLQWLDERDARGSELSG